jgi:hypothetical protein
MSTLTDEEYNIDDSDGLEQIPESIDALFDYSLLIKDTYRTVWKEFCEWEKSSNAAALQGLQRAFVPDSTYEAAVLYESYRYCQSTERGKDTATVTRWKGVSVTESPVYYPKDTGVVQLPAYEACSPSNICRGRGLTDRTAQAVPFIPYSDDPGFPFQQYVNNFRRLGWMKDDLRENSERKCRNIIFTSLNISVTLTVEQIALETVRRLVVNHHAPDFKKIDCAGPHCFPELIDPTQPAKGVLWANTQR